MTGLGRPATYSRTGACRTLRIWMRRCVLLRSVKIAAYQQQYVDNQNISFLPSIVSTSTRIHGEFLRLLFLQAHRETEAHFTAIGMSSQHINTEALRFKRADARGILQRPEEQSRTGGGQGSSVAGQPQCPRL